MIEVISIVLISAGFLFFFATSVGVVRLPDFYCRMHAAGKGDTLSTALILTGLALYNLAHFSGDALLVSVKIMFIAVFIFLASPTASHAILDAGFETGAEPWTRDSTRQDAEGGDGKGGGA